jgi:tetratricopeptide (TPR) repeat protein
MSRQRNGDLDGAISDFSQAIRLAPIESGIGGYSFSTSDAYWLRGWAYTEKGRYDDAIADYTMSIHLAGDRAEAYEARAYACEKKGDHDGAIFDCTDAVRLDPTLAVAYYDRGRAYLEKGETAKAREDFTQAEKLGYKPK